MCTRERPQLGRGRQSSRNRIGFDVFGNPNEFSLVPNVMIVGFSPPEWVAGASQNAISFASGRSLQPACDDWHGHQRQDQQVDMIRHDHPRVKLVESSALRAMPNRARHNLSNGGILQPQSTLLMSRQRTIMCGKRVAFARVLVVQNVLRQRTVKTPSDEKISILWMKVWHLSLILVHLAFFLGRPKGLPYQASALVNKKFSCG